MEVGCFVPVCIFPKVINDWVLSASLEMKCSVFANVVFIYSINKLNNTYCISIMYGILDYRIHVIGTHIFIDMRIKILAAK